MVKNRAWLLIAILVFLISCSKEKNKVFEVEEVVSKADVALKFEIGIELPHVCYANVASNGKVLLLYGMNAAAKNFWSINLYDMNLNLISSDLIPLGQGPGDISSSCSMDLDDQFLYASENGNMRVSLFDYRSGMKLVQCIKNKDKRIFYAPRVSDDFRHIAFSFLNWKNNNAECENVVYRAKFPDFSSSKELTVIHSGKLFTADHKSILDHAPFGDYFFRDHFLFVLNMRDYTITKFNEKWNPLNKVKIRFKGAKMAVAEKKDRVRELLGKREAERNTLSDDVLPASWMIPLGQGFAVLRRQNYKQSSFSEMTADYFDYNLKLIGKIKLPYFYRCNTLRFPSLNQCTCFCNGWLFTIDDTNTNWRLLKWRVDESKKITVKEKESSHNGKAHSVKPS